MEARAVEMRLNGATFDAIGKELGLTHQAAWCAVDRCLKRNAAERAKGLDQLREAHATRLDVAIQAVWPRVQEGDDTAMKSMDLLMKRQAALLGLDAPARSAVEVSNPAAEAEARARKRAMAADPEAARLLQELAARQATIAPVEPTPEADGHDGDEPDAD